MSTLEPTDGEAADPGAITTIGSFTAITQEFVADMRETLSQPSQLFRRWFTPWELPDRNPMPSFTPFTRVAVAERFVRRVWRRLREAWRRVNSAVDELRYGDTGDW